MRTEFDQVKTIKESESWDKPINDPGGQDDQRARPRHASSQLAELKFRDKCAVVEAIDVSAGGARCRIVSGLAPMNYDFVDLSFLDGTQRSGKICWSGNSDFGIEFDDEINDPEDITHHEHLGFDYYQSIIKLQKKRQAHMAHLAQ